MDLSDIFKIVSFTVVSISILLFVIRVVFPRKDQGFGLEKMYPILLLILALFLYLLLISKSVTENTFSIVIGVIVGSIVTNFSTVIEAIKGNWKKK